jgi:serine/threonine-protein kinase
LTPNLRLRRPLGRGGMGVLWIAEHRALGTEVVVKFLSDELLGDPSAARRIAREAAAAAQVRSPHVAQVFDHGVSESGLPFIVMERLTGCDLRTLLETRGTLSLEETTTIIVQLAKALRKTHLAGIVHRDVKPSNIFLCDSEDGIFVKLLDFGLAQHSAMDSSLSSGSHRCAGTPPYMSPEQLIGDPVDARSDIWSLGAVAFECLTGRRPFAGETLGAFTLAIHTLALPALTQFKPELPPRIDAWFGRACARSREDRFGSATEAAEAMARALGVPLPGVRYESTLPSPGLEDRTITDDFALTRAGLRRPAKTRRSPLAWVAFATIGVGAAGAAGGAWHANARPKNASARSAETAEVRLAKQPGAKPQAEVTPEPTVSTEPESPASFASGFTKGRTPPVLPIKRNPTAVPSAHASSSPARVVDAAPRLPPIYELPDERY